MVIEYDPEGLDLQWALGCDANGQLTAKMGLTHLSQLLSALETILRESWDPDAGFGVGLEPTELRIYMSRSEKPWNPPQALVEITSATGWKIMLHSFYQERTYGGLLLGSPDKRLNDWTLANLESRAKEKLGDFPVIVLDAAADVRPDGEERLPPILCMGNFDTFRPSGQQGLDCNIVWFEETVEPRISSRTFERIRLLDWDGIGGT